MILTTLRRKTCSGEFCMFWYKLKFDATEFDVDGPAFPPEKNYQGAFMIKLRHITVNQQVICIDFVYSGMR